MSASLFTVQFPLCAGDSTIFKEKCYTTKGFTVHENIKTFAILGVFYELKMSCPTVCDPETAAKPFVRFS